MKFIQTIKQSLYSPEFYRSQQNVSFGTPFKYFLKLVTIQALIMTFVLALFVFPIISKVISKEGTDFILSYYPADLELTLKGGQLSTNVQEPFMVPMPQGWIMDNDNDKVNGVPANKLPTNLAVIDTKAVSALDSLAKYDTLILLTKDALISTDNEGETVIQSFKDFPAGTFSRQTLVWFVDMLRPFLKYLIPLAFLALMIGLFVASSIAHMIQLLFVALIIWTVSLIRKTGITYGQAYNMSLYGVTAAIILGTLVLSVGAHLPIYIFCILTTVMMLINTKTIGSKSETSATPQP